MAGKRLCRFCRAEVDPERPKSTLVPYMGGWLHLECWKKLARMAARSGGAL